MDDSRATPSADLLSLVSRSYPLTGVRVDRDLGGSYNLNLLMHADEGSFVVRVYMPWVETARLSALQTVRAYLGGRGWPVAPLLCTRSGEGFTRLGRRLVEVESFVDSGGAEMYSLPLLQAGMPAMARLHDDLRDAPMSPDAARPPVANHVAAGEVVALTAPAIASIRSWATSPAERRYVDAAERLATALRDVHVELPVQLVHGDFWDTNVHVDDGGRVVLLIDLDFLGVRPRIDDLALTLFYTNDHFGRDDLSSDRLAMLRDLVDRYNRALEQPLSAAERDALPYAIARSPLTFVRDIAYQGAAVRSELTDLRGPEYLWALRALDSPAWLRAFST